MGFVDQPTGGDAGLQICRSIENRILLFSRRVESGIGTDVVHRQPFNVMLRGKAGELNTECRTRNSEVRSEAELESGSPDFSAKAVLGPAFMPGCHGRRQLRLSLVYGASRR